LLLHLLLDQGGILDLVLLCGDLLPLSAPYAHYIVDAFFVLYPASVALAVGEGL